MYSILFGEHWKMINNDHPFLVFVNLQINVNI